jgi:hypothetical protein
MTKKEVMNKVDEYQIELVKLSQFLEELSTERWVTDLLGQENFSMLLVGVDYLDTNLNLIGDRLRMS